LRRETSCGSINSIHNSITSVGSKNSSGTMVSMDDMEKECDDQLISQGIKSRNPQTSAKIRNGMTMEEFRDAADFENVMNSTSLPASSSFALSHRKGMQSKVGPLHRAGHFLLSVYGLIPWFPRRRDLMHRITISLVLLLAASHAMYLSIVEQHANYEHLPTVCLAMGTFCGIMDLLWFGFRFRYEQLSRYISEIDCTAEWYRKSLSRFMAISGLSGGAAITKFTFWMHPACQVTPPGETNDVHSLLHLIFFFALFGALTVITYCQSHVDLALEFLVERCSMEYARNPDTLHAIKSWNTIQSIIRRTGRTIENSFLALITSSLVLFVWATVQVIEGAGRTSQFKTNDVPCIALHSGWMVSPVLLAMYAICCAAALTRRCSRAPSFVNSLWFEDESINLGTRDVVQHMQNSDAGLFIKGARVTPHMAIKLAYILGVVCFTVLSRNFSSL